MRGSGGVTAGVAALATAVIVAVPAMAGSGAGAATTRAAAAGSVQASDCPVKALKPGQKVTIEFWQREISKNEELLKERVAAFEAANPNISVRVVNQVNYTDLFTKYKSALSSGRLPDVAQFEETTVQQLVDSQSTIPMGACVKADRYSLRDFLERPLAFYTTQGVLRSMPWNVSNVVTVFNRKAMEQAGLDPDALPTTFDGLRQVSQQLVDKGVVPHGIAFAAKSYISEYLFAKSGVQYVNHGNGRRARATAATFATPGGTKIWAWIQDMVQSGLAVNTGTNPDSFDNMFALGNGNAAITFDSSSVLGPAYDLLGKGQFPNVELGVAPLPTSKPRNGVPVGDGSLWLPRTGSAAREAAAWKLVKFLEEPAQLAALVVGSDGGYIPIRRSVVKDPGVQALWAERPFLRVPYDQVARGRTTTTTSGSIIGNYQGVREAVAAGFERLLTQGQDAAKAIDQTQADATRAIQEYNARIG